MISGPSSLKAPADQDLAGSVEQRDPDIGAIGFCLGHLVSNRERIALGEIRLRSACLGDHQSPASFENSFTTRS